MMMMKQLNNRVSTTMIFLLTMSMMLVVTTHALVATTSASTEQQSWPIMSKGAFTSSECDTIRDLYISQLQRVEDTREADSVSRINRFDVQGKLLQNGDLDWIMDRVATHLPTASSGGSSTSSSSSDISDDDDHDHESSDNKTEQLKNAIDFTLLHEFNPGMHFGLHVDTRPNDGTHRTMNVNIMLSDPSQDYTGGSLQIGINQIQPQKGDLYMYPASYPHAVLELDTGLRYTYVMALTIPKNRRSDQQQASYWAASETRLQALATQKMIMGDDDDDGDDQLFKSKLHLIHAQFLEASGDRSDPEIDAAYCKAYKATPEAALYAQQFFNNGKAALAAAQHPAADNYFQMAICVDSTVAPAVQQARLLAQNNNNNNNKLFGVASNKEL
jgi:hypothetical protein